MLEDGAKLGHYTIVGPLGAGGMGEVYRAQDTKLDREVAIKVLPESFAENEERVARFEREAKSLAALNHPNIATIHGFEQEGDTAGPDGPRSHFLVMELVEGEDLAERLRRGPVPIDEATSLFIQIAEGLEAAHEKGIIHRDPMLGRRPSGESRSRRPSPRSRTYSLARRWMTGRAWIA